MIDRSEETRKSGFRQKHEYANMLSKNEKIVVAFIASIPKAIRDDNSCYVAAKLAAKDAWALDSTSLESVEAHLDLALKNGILSPSPFQLPPPSDPTVRKILTRWLAWAKKPRSQAYFVRLKEVFLRHVN